jgi:hypothetical protein
VQKRNCINRSGLSMRRYSRKYIDPCQEQKFDIFGDGQNPPV